MSDAAPTRPRAPGRRVAGLRAELRADDHLRREAFAMSLYICVVLLSALTVLGGSEPTQGTVFLLILGTTVGLVLAHAFAHWLAARMVLVAHDQQHPSPAAVLRVQLVGAAAVSAVAGLAVAVASTANELAVAQVSVAATIALLVFGESRRTHTPARALASGALALVVAWSKAALVH